MVWPLRTATPMSYKALLFLMLACLPVTAQGNACVPLADTEKAKIVVYLSKWIGVPETEKLEIESDEFVPGTCYRRLEVRGRTLRPASFFLSPDQRFLTGLLLDLMGDPKQERSQAQEEINGVLLSEPSPTRGMPTDPVTIVEFGDFECPFCKRFFEWTQLLVSGKGANFRVVFKHLPTEGHPWAKNAAAFAICAETQSNDAFWQLHDFFYKNQATLNTATFQDRVMQYVADLPTIDGPRLLNCVRSHQADARMTRDAELAKQFRITATPTIFVNGIRVGALQSEDDLRSLIQRAYRESQVGNEAGGDK
jgi:protein-disulfide isomerase